MIEDNAATPVGTNTTGRIPPETWTADERCFVEVLEAPSMLRLRLQLPARIIRIPACHPFLAAWMRVFAFSIAAGDAPPHRGHGTMAARLTPDQKVTCLRSLA